MMNKRYDMILAKDLTLPFPCHNFHAIMQRFAKTRRCHKNLPLLPSEGDALLDHIYKTVQTLHERDYEVIMLLCIISLISCVVIHERLANIFCVD